MNFPPNLSVNSETRVVDAQNNRVLISIVKGQNYAKQTLKLEPFKFIINVIRPKENTTQKRNLP